MNRTEITVLNETNQAEKGTRHVFFHVHSLHLFMLYICVRREGTMRGNRVFRRKKRDTEERNRCVRKRNAGTLWGIRGPGKGGGGHLGKPARE